MHRFARIVCIGLLFSAFALTAPVACAPGSLQSYLDLGPEGCSVADKSVFGFELLERLAGATEISPAGISVIPVTTPLNPGFRLDFSSEATAAELLESRLTFTVLMNPGGGPIGRVRTAIAGSAATGNAAVTGITDLCLGDEFGFDVGACPVGTDTQIVFKTGLDSLLGESRGFVPVAKLGVITDIALDGGGNGTASLSSFTIRFQEVPEPATLIPVMASLLALTFLRHRR